MWPTINKIFLTLTEDLKSISTSFWLHKHPKAGQNTQHRFVGKLKIGARGGE